MNKIILNIDIPAAGKCLEIRASKNVKIGHVIKMVCRYIETNKNIDFTPSEDTRLCDKRKGVVYSYNSFIYELELGEGQTLTLV